MILVAVPDICYDFRHIMNDDLLVEFGLVDNDNDAVHDNQNTPFGAGDGIVADNDGAVDTRAGASTTVHISI